MAEVAFDKHMAFCEEYVQEMHRVLEKLFTDGPGKQGLELSGNLHKIRAKHRPWIVQDVETVVLRYEMALSQIGIDAMSLEFAEGKKRETIVNRMFSTFAAITEASHDGPVDATIATSEIISHLQKSLGINELAELRGSILSAALRANKNAQG